MPTIEDIASHLHGAKCFSYSMQRMGFGMSNWTRSHRI